MNRSDTDIELLLDELEETKRGIENTINESGFVRFPNDFTFFSYGNDNELNDKYLCYTPNLETIKENKKEDLVIVSGIGATNAPTMGTMSEILKIIDAQKKTGIYTHFIINDFGSINARSIGVKKALQLTDQYKSFVRKMGFDETNGRICTHNDIDHARTFSLVARMIQISDFSGNTEATDKTYDRLGLRGRDFPVLIDHVYTATDVLLPIIKDQKKGVVVICGLDEFYHANIGGIALSRMIQDPDLKLLIPDGVDVGAIYSRIVSGLHPYFKQSKSIQDSSINLGQDESTIRALISDSSGINDTVVLEMIELASDWSRSKIDAAKSIFSSRENNSKQWQSVKDEYTQTVLDFKRLWESARCEDRTIRDQIFEGLSE